MAGFNNDVVFAQEGLRIGATTITSGELASIQFDESGSDVSLLINNTSANVGSTSSAKLLVGGASSGDPSVQFEVNGIQTISVGLDNSAADSFAIAIGTNLSVTPILHAFTSRNMIFGDGLVDPIASNDQFSFRRNVAAGTGSGLLQLSVRNSNLVDGGTLIACVGESASTNDPIFQAQVNGGNTWTWGVDNSDSDSFNLAQGLALPGTVLTMTATTDGEVTFPATPAFLATHSVAQNNVTGNLVEVTVNYTTEIFDQNGDYDGTNTFTAPITGRYQFEATIEMTGATDAEQGYIYLNASNRSILGTQTAPYSKTNLNAFQLIISSLVDMDAADTINVIGACIGMADDTADVPADVTSTHFSGHLAC